MIAAGLLGLALSVPVAFALHLLNGRFDGNLESAVSVGAVLLVSLASLPVAAYFLVRGKAAIPARMGQIAFASVCIVLSAVYLYCAASYIVFPADILIWSESDFVSDVAKLRLHYPLYTDQADNTSYIYPPGAQFVTYALANAIGQSSSVPALRAFQLLYTMLAAVFAALCALRILELANIQIGERAAGWGIGILPLLFLVATNSITNPFTHYLHNDALAQLLHLIAFWILLKYAHTRNTRVLAAMAAIPAAGFMVKQSLAAWAAFYVAYLILFDRPRSLARAAAVAIGAFGLLGLAIAACYLAWGHPFFFWVFEVIGKHGVSPLRSVQHALTIWPYFLIGVAALGLLANARNLGALIGPWVIALAILATQTYTSGIAWMLNHIGPGCLLAAVWLAAAVMARWPESAAVKGRWAPGHDYVRAAISLLCLGLLLPGLGVVRMPVPALTKDTLRYVRDIERQFENQPAERVLLDAGSWLYMKANVIMKDRAASAGDRGYSGVGDFSSMLQRLRSRAYSRILVRNFDSPDFWYDHHLWRNSSKVRQALLDNYTVVAKIPAATQLPGHMESEYLFREISVLEPRGN
jgi:hypothetical protein